MAYINVGAFVNEERPRTKKALREALASAPDTVWFDQTSAFLAPGWDPRIHLDGLEPGVTLTVVGPDPYRDRRWYASVTRDRAGKIRVS
jgi:hypothetical protein